MLLRHVPLCLAWRWLRPLRLIQAVARCLQSAVGLALLSLVAACSPAPRDLPPPQELGALIVATRLSPAGVYEDAEGLAGFEHDLVQTFADSLGVPVRFLFVDSDRRMYQALDRGAAHLAAAGAAVSKGGQMLVRFGPPYQSLRQVVAVRRGSGVVVNSLNDLGPYRGWVIVASPAARSLAAQRTGQAFSGLEAGPPGEAADALQRLAEGELDYAIVDSILLERMRHWLIDLEPAFSLPGERTVAWAFARYGNDPLFATAGDFIRQALADGRIRALADRHYAHLQRLASADIDGILAHRYTRLPRFRRHFQDAAAETGIDWRWLAALAYQESKWDPLATSWTNVRGMMQLTEATADRYGVLDRLDARASILGGARFLADLMTALPDDVPAAERLPMALAAYNLGEGHLRAGRRLAAQMGFDPNSWSGLRQALPQLARPEIGARLVSGPARGGEAVILAENVRAYYEVLVAADGEAATSSPFSGWTPPRFYRPPVTPPPDPIIW